MEELGGKKVFVNPLTTYYENLEKVNESLQKQGKAPILIEKADKSLIDEDLLEMVNAGILPATVTLAERADLWASVFSGITPQPKLVVGTEGDLAFAMRKNNPQLKQLVDEFVKTHAMGTSFGNTLWRRYLQSDQWVKNPTTAAELKKFERDRGLLQEVCIAVRFRLPDGRGPGLPGVDAESVGEESRWCSRHHAGQTVHRGGAADQHPRHRDGGEQYSRRSEAAEFDCNELFQRSED